MNTYSKYVPNVFLAKCTERHEKGEKIEVETKYGKSNESIVYNLIGQKDGFFYYSIVRADGFNVQEFAKRKAEKLQNAARNAERKGMDYWRASHEGADFLSLGEPIKVGHHSEKRHRSLIERNHNRMGKYIESLDVVEKYESRADYWERKANVINLSMPESIEFYEYKVAKAKEYHEGLKNGTIERGHSFSLTYAKKDLNEAEKNLLIAKKLWE